MSKKATSQKTSDITDMQLRIGALEAKTDIILGKLEELTAIITDFGVKFDLFREAGLLRSEAVSQSSDASGGCEKKATKRPNIMNYFN